jgi:Fic family protein
MPKLIPEHELDQLVALIAGDAEGLTLDALLHGLAGKVQRRSLQRRLRRLLDSARVRRTGEGRSARYVGLMTTAGTHSAGTATTAATAPAPGEVYLPLSPEGEAIRAYVRRPRQARTPVGYQLGFLESYTPNVSAYLPHALRAQLHTLGRSPADASPAGTFARDILARLLIDLSWASSRLEGNTYSRLDTERLIAFGTAAEGHDALEAQMILNHKDAIEYLINAQSPDREGNSSGPLLNPSTVIALHAFLSDGLLADPSACGRVRRRAVEIGGSVYRPMAIPDRLEELFDIVVRMAAEVNDPFEQAFFLMVHLPYLQPFEDVNQRVSRLAANIPLIRHNLCPLSFIDVPPSAYIDAMIGVYELNQVDLLRDVFVWAYARSCQQYVAVKQSMVPPDTFRLRYRQALNEVVRATVQALETPTAPSIAERTPPSIADADRAHFTALVIAEFATLHAGNAVRFGLRPLEWAAWQVAQQPVAGLAV